jgi:hypothetical protein
MTISEAFEAYAVSQTASDLGQAWPHVVRLREDVKAPELLSWLSANVRSGCTIEWPAGLPVMGLNDQDEAFALRMRWA